jgi:hypothetical protein
MLISLRISTRQFDEQMSFEEYHALLRECYSITGITKSASLPAAVTTTLEKDKIAVMTHGQMT